MALSRVDDLLQVLRSLDLLEPGQVASLVKAQANFPDARSLAQKLVNLKWLTAFQARQLLKDQGKELALGQYVLLDKLGEGGMGQVFKARHKVMGRVVALKVIRKERLTKPDVIRRFEREVRLAAQLTHPNVVAAFDADQVADTLILVMEYVDGVNLSQLVKQQGKLPVAQACLFIRQAACGLAYAHRRGVIHRDIKPSNLLAAKSPGAQAPDLVKILDMGLARVDEGDLDPSGELTMEGQLVGTPDYIAPEQARSARSADARCDLYSLGCTFYFLLAGQVPFPGGSMTEKLVKHQREQPAPLEQLRPEVPPAIAALVRRLLAKNPDDRLQTADEVVAALPEAPPPAAAAPPVALLLPAAMVANAAAPAAIPLSAAPATGKFAAPKPRRRVWLGLLLTGGALLIFAALVAVFFVLLPYLVPAGPPPETRPRPTVKVTAAARGRDRAADNQTLGDKLESRTSTG